MSVPEVGDRVRVIAGQWTGWEGVVTWSAQPQPWCDVRLDTLPTGEVRRIDLYTRSFTLADLEKVPTTPTDGHRGDETGTGPS